MINLDMKRQVRLNEIDACILMSQFRYAGAAQTPEEYHSIIENERKLKILQAEERRVIERFERITGRNLAAERAARIEQSKPPVPDWREFPAHDLPF